MQSCSRCRFRRCRINRTAQFRRPRECERGDSGRAATYLVLASALLLLAGCRAGHAEPALLSSAARERVLRRQAFGAAADCREPWRAAICEADTYFYTGKIGSNDGDYMPFPVTAEVLARGQQRFNIYCSPCHSEIGDGNGMIVQRGYKRPPSYHTERLRKAPIGYFFDVMTNGFGAMPDYARAGRPPGPLGDCRLHSCSAIEPACQPGGCCPRAADRRPAAVGRNHHASVRHTGRNHCGLDAACSRSRAGQEGEQKQ